nr:integrase core domain-containing protein [Mesorhizobium loti]
MAIANRQPEPGSLVHHSDHPIRLRSLLRSSASSRYPGEHEPCRNPYDNVNAESFMKTLKQEEVQGLTYKDAADARKRIGAFIDSIYNQQRLHSALDYLTPEEYEQKHSRRREMERAA